MVKGFLNGLFIFEETNLLLKDKLAFVYFFLTNLESETFPTNGFLSLRVMHINKKAYLRIGFLVNLIVWVDHSFGHIVLQNT